MHGWRKTKKRFDLTSFSFASSVVVVDSSSHQDEREDVSVDLSCVRTNTRRERKHQHEWNYWRMWANDESGGISVASRIVIDKLRRGFDEVFAYLHDQLVLVRLQFAVLILQLKRSLRNRDIYIFFAESTPHSRHQHHRARMLTIP